MAAKCIVCDSDLHCKVEPCEHGESVAWYCPECTINSLCAERDATLLRVSELEKVVEEVRDAYHSLRMSSTGLSSRDIVPHHAVQTRLLERMGEALGWPDYKALDAKEAP